MANKSVGQIITFYSYKGGTGRSMTLANVACILAEREDLTPGKGVLMMDWDLEAPGLHRYFCDRLAPRKRAADSRGTGSCDAEPGLIELFYELDSRIDNLKKGRGGVSEPEMLLGEETARSIFDAIDLDKYIIPTKIGGLSLIKAGRFNPRDSNEYPEKVNKFSWEALYNKSPHSIRVFAEVLAERFDYVLIDSRTGVTDISGVCTMLLPEKLVVVFTPNMQSLMGAVEVVARATDYRKESDDLRALVVFPLVSRVESNEPDLRHDWRFGNPDKKIIGYQAEFEKALAEAYGKNYVKLDNYFDEMQIQHIPRYAYGEEIAVIEEKSEDKFSLRRSYRTFANRLVEPGLPWEEMSADKIPAPTVTAPQFPAPEVLGAETGAAGKSPSGPHWISPSAAAFVVICFFLPWIERSCGGTIESLSGADMAKKDGSYWLFPLAAIVAIAAYFIFKFRNKLWKAQSYILVSSIVGLLFLIYKISEIFGNRFLPPADVGVKLLIGTYGTFIGFIGALIGCAFLGRGTAAAGLSAASGSGLSGGSTGGDRAMEYVQQNRQTAPGNKSIIAALAGVCLLLIVLVIVLFALWSSRSGGNPPANISNENTKISDKLKLPASFDSVYSGSFTNTNISLTMSLRRNGDALTGTAATSSRNEMLAGSIDETGDFRLEGRENGTKLTGIYTGHIDSDGRITGQWSKTDGTMSAAFSLVLSQGTPATANSLTNITPRSQVFFADLTHFYSILKRLE